MLAGMVRLRDIIITPEQSQAARHHEIEVRYREMARRKGRKPVTFAAIRAAELAQLYAARYGREIPDTDDGLVAVRVMLHHLARLRNADRRMATWIDRHAPWLELPAAERLIREATEKPLRWKADKLAWKLHITAAERTELGLRTIGAIDQSTAQRLELATKRRRLSEEARRRNSGAKPRAEYEAHSLAKRQPWIAMGISRAQWYRKGKPAPPTAGE